MKTDKHNVLQDKSTFRSSGALFLVVSLFSINSKSQWD